MSGLARNRLMEERKQWRLDHPIGFYARPSKKDGEINLMRWECGIPGVENTLWAGGLYNLIMDFSEDYPIRPPKCCFSPPLFHPNIFPSGMLCLSIINSQKGWRPSITVKQILLGIQELLDNPNPDDPADSEALSMFKNSRSEYDKKVKQRAAECAL